MKALAKGEGPQEDEIDEMIKHYCEKQSRYTEDDRASSPVKNFPYHYNNQGTETCQDGIEDKCCRIKYSYMRIRYPCPGFTEREIGIEWEEGRRNRQMIQH